MTDDAAMCGKPFCDGPCDAEMHETPAALRAIIDETGSACPDCDSTGFGFAAEFQTDEPSVHLLVLWHADTCPSLVTGGYVIANLFEIALKTSAAIEAALMRITGNDIRTAGSSLSHNKVIARHDLGEVVLPDRTVRAARKIAAREARQASRRPPPDWRDAVGAPRGQEAAQ